MAFTLDKYGKPIPPQVLDILNRPVPVLKRHRSRITVPSQPELDESLVESLGEPYGADSSVLNIPPISDVPDLFSSRTSRKVPCERVPCEGPLSLEPANPEDDLDQSDPPSELLQPSDQPYSLFSDRFTWIKSVLNRVASARPQRIRAVTATAELQEEKPTVAAVQIDFPERTGCIVRLSTYNVSETPGCTSRPRGQRLNSDFYRVLALENAMCSKGKLQEASASMFLYPKQEPTEPQYVLGIQQKLRRRRERQWHELTAADFGVTSEDDFDE